VPTSLEPQPQGKSTRFETPLEPESLCTIWRVLNEHRISEEALENGAVWFHAPAYCRGLPVEFRHQLSEPDVEICLSRSRSAAKPSSPAGMLRLAVEARNGQEDAARELMARLVQRLEAERRKECRSAEHFLGNPEFAWNEMQYPPMFLDLYASKRTYDHASLPLGELLVQLDGMHSNEGILVIATTNDLDAIEPALKDRPSRFDRVIEFDVASEPVRLTHRLHQALQLSRAA
jgi:hypothetical protein